MRRGTAYATLLLLAAFMPRAVAAGPALVIELSNSKELDELLSATAYEEFVKDDA